MDNNIFKRKSVWIFDLDNTIYDPQTKIFNQIDERMKSFISENIFISKKEALILQKKYYKQYGTTLYGLMKHHNVDPEEFLDFVHNIDLQILKKNPILHRKIKALPGEKIIYTKGSTFADFSSKYNFQSSNVTLLTDKKELFSNKKTTITDKSNLYKFQ